MKLSDNAVGLVGTDIEYPEFDPWGLTKGASEDKIAWLVYLIFNSFK